MARRQNLFARLDALEHDYSIAAAAELRAILDGGLGHYLGSRLREDWATYVGKALTSCAERDMLVELERDIAALRSSLGLDPRGPALAIVDALLDAIRAEGGTHTAHRYELLRHAVQQLEAVISQKDGA